MVQYKSATTVDIAAGPFKTVIWEAGLSGIHVRFSSSQLAGSSSLLQDIGATPHVQIVVAQLSFVPMGYNPDLAKCL
eukprot:jgi/Botrbrau1/6482/Bobra.0034s0055.1